jgi:copper chaperone CopZ
MAQHGGYTTLVNARSVVRIESNGAHCGLEAARDAILKMDGIFDVDANHLSETLAVEYDSEKVTLDQIRNEIKNACG